MEQLNSATHKYFLNVSMNKIVHHITIAVVLQTVEFRPHKVTIIELRIFPRLMEKNNMSHEPQCHSRQATVAAHVTLHFTVAQLETFLSLRLAVTITTAAHMLKITCTVKTSLMQ